MPEDLAAENRRLIALQLDDIKQAVEKLSERVVSMDDKARDRAGLFEAKVGSEMTGVNVRIAMLEVRAKIWGGLIGSVGGGVVAAIIEFLVKSKG